MKSTFTLLTLLISLFCATVLSANSGPSPYFSPSAIQLSAFEGRGIDQGVVLFWESDVEWQADKYIVQRSNDGSSWESIGSLPAAGNNVGRRSYVYVDETPYVGMNFYRLLQKDYLGESHVSSYLDIDYDGAYDPTIFPNPVRLNGDVNINFFGFENQEMQAELIDINGRRIVRESFDLTEGENRLSMEIPNGVTTGIYFVRLFVDDYPVSSYRLMINGL